MKTSIPKIIFLCLSNIDPSTSSSSRYVGIMWGSWRRWSNINELEKYQWWWTHEWWMTNTTIFCLKNVISDEKPGRENFTVFDFGLQFHSGKGDKSFLLSENSTNASSSSSSSFLSQKYQYLARYVNYIWIHFRQTSARRVVELVGPFIAAAAAAAVAASLQISK